MSSQAELALVWIQLASQEPSRGMSLYRTLSHPAHCANCVKIYLWDFNSWRWLSEHGEANAIERSCYLHFPKEGNTLQHMRPHGEAPGLVRAEAGAWGAHRPQNLLGFPWQRQSLGLAWIILAWALKHRGCPWLSGTWPWVGTELGKYWLGVWELNKGGGGGYGSGIG